MRRILIPILALLFVMPGVLADYQCVAISPEVQIDCPTKVELGKDFVVTAEISSLEPFYQVKARIKNDGGFTEQDVYGYFRDNKWNFEFDSINTPDNYFVTVYFDHPFLNEEVEETCPKSFEIRDALYVTVGTFEPIFYDVEDMKLEVTVSPTSVAPVFELDVYIDNSKINAAVQHKPKGSGIYELTVKKEDIRCRGELPLKFHLKVRDFYDNYDEWSGWTEGLTCAPGEVEVDIIEPLNVKVDETHSIKITTKNVDNEPMDVRELEVKVRFAGSGEEVYEIHDLDHPKVGTYTLVYTFVNGQQHYIEATASDPASGYLPGYDEVNIPVTGGAVCACDTDDACQEGCTCDPDCTKPWWEVNWMLIIPLIIGIALFVMWLRGGKKKGKKK